MARRKNPPSDTTLYIALAAAGAALYYLLSPSKAAAKPPVIGDNPFGPPNGGPPDGALPDGFMPTDKAMILQKNLNYFPSNIIEPLVEDGLFGPKSWAFFQSRRPLWVEAANAATANDIKDVKFFASVDTFNDPIDSDKVTFRLKGSSDSVTLRKSLYDKLSAVDFKGSGVYYNAADAAAYAKGIE